MTGGSVRFRSVIFDLDGLICDTEPLYMRAVNLVLLAASSNYQFQAEEYGRTLTGKPVFGNSEYLRWRFGLEASALDITEAVLALFNVLISNPANVIPMPGLSELLEYLTQHRIPAAVASASRPEHVERMVSALRLGRTFAVVAGSDESVPRKPAPDVYLRALNELGAKASEALAIEDSLSGVRAARAAEIFVIAVKNAYTRSHDLTEADLVMDNLLQVRDFLSSAG